MNRDELIAEIKKLLQEELKAYAQPLVEQIPPEYKKQAADLQDEARSLVKEHPLVSVGLAVTVGFFIARALYNRKD